MQILQNLKSFLSCLINLWRSAGCLRDQLPIVQTSGYASVDHGKLFYEAFGSGTPILVVHGGPGLGHTHLLPQMLELAKDHTLIFYDQRGSGKSLNVALDEKYITIEQFTKDLEDVRAELDINKVTLMGHSWGAFLSLQYALKYPQHVSQLILLNPNPVDYKGREEFEEEFSKSVAPISDKIAPLLTPEGFKNLSTQEIWEVYRNLFSVYFADPCKTQDLTLDITQESAVNGQRVMRKIRAIIMNPGLTLFPALSHLKVPTLIIHGNQDIVPASAAQDIKDAMLMAKIVYLENCGHFPFIEQPTQLFEAIRDFLQENN